MPRQKQTTIDKLSIEQLTANFVKCSIIVGRTGIPVILFKKTMDEAESAVQEEVTLMVRRHILNIVYSFGGFVPLTFHRLRVFTIDEFVRWMVRRNRQLLLQCIDNLRAIGSKNDNQRGNGMCRNHNVIEPICWNSHGKSSET